MKIVKVKVVQEYIEKLIKEQGMTGNDLLLISIDKIEGSPTAWLQKKFLIAH